MTAREKSDQVVLARRFAALSGPFDPPDALKASVPADGPVDIAISVASHLAAACDTRAGKDGAKWLMRASERQWEIGQLRREEQLKTALEWRRMQEPFDSTAQDLSAALCGAGLFKPDVLEQYLATTKSGADGEQRAKLERLACALEWAGPAGPAYEHLEWIRAALSRLDDQARADWILASGFHGRQEDRAALSAWLTHAAATLPVRAMFVTGLPAIGKSALLEIAVRDAVTGGQPLLVVRLDFDRSGLDVLDQVGLTLETVRQIANQLPEQARTFRVLRMEASAALEDELKGRGRDKLPSELARALGTAVASSNHTVVMVLDTMEVLRGRGETHPRRLFEWLDSLVSMGLAPLSVIAAGRGDTLDAIPDRVGGRLDLAGLGPKAAAQLLDTFDIPQTARPHVQAFAQGNPLLLKLAATAVKEDVTKVTAARRLQRKPGKVAAAHLYRFLLSRIADPDLKMLVDPGLLVRRINHEVIREVLGPALGLKGISKQRAKRLVEGLGTQHWLVERDSSAEGWLRQRPDMRAVLLPLFYRTKRAQCARIDRVAADWFAGRSEPWLIVEGIYHRLQLMRRGDPAPAIDPDAAQKFDEAMLHELSDQARDAVLHARGQRSTFARGTHSQSSAESIDSRAVKDMQLVIGRGDWEEAADLYARVFAPAVIEPASLAGDSARTFLWRTGRWREAKGLLAALDTARPGKEDLRQLRPTDALARLEMRAEFSFGKLVRRLLADDELMSAAQNIASRGEKTEMVSGALGFALRQCGIKVETPWRRADPIHAADEIWGAGYSGTAASSAVSFARERMSRRLPYVPESPQTRTRSEDPEVFDLAMKGRYLAVLSPYIAPISLMTRFEAIARLRPYAESVLACIARLDAWWNGDFKEAANSPSGTSNDSIETLADLGLLAEWIGVASFIWRNPDLTLLARGAEVWRRTTAGHWAYGSAPTDWIGARLTEGLDATTWVRVHELLEADDPVECSRTALEAWTEPTISEARQGRVAKRLAAAIAGARAEVGELRLRRGCAIGAARALIKRNMPSAFVPALSVLAAFESISKTSHRMNTSQMEHSMQEESKSRLESFFASKRKVDAVAKSIEHDRFPIGQLGLSKKQVLDALQASPAKLESIGMAPAGLEAIIRRVGRPPLVVRNGLIELELLDDFPVGTDVKIKAAELFVGSAGRVEFVNHSMKWGGTGWVVDKKNDGHLILTNRHVARLVARRAQNGSGVFIRSPVSGVRYGASIDFNEEVEATPQQARVAQVVEIVYLADDFSADAALLKVKKADAGDWKMPDPIPLAANEPKDEELVALVGYPAYDSRNDITDMERYFRDLYDVKRFAPGLVIKTQEKGLLSHDCTSLGGNSGSPLISLEQQAVVGLHFAGVYGVENSAVSVTTLKRLLKGELVPVEGRAETKSEAADGVHSANDLARRDGYSPVFLGQNFPVPWPVLPEEIEKDLAAPSDATEDRPHELRYTHFGVKFSSAFRLPVLTAVNIDGEESVRIKRGSDKWFFDARIPKELQHGQDAYRDALIDRGHMVRREDPNWGPDASQADGDTFHYTNSAPQHSALNQGKTLWQGLENYVLDSARTHGFKACVITGPVFSDEDPELEEQGGIRVPLEFWKVVAMIDNSREKLHVTAYLLSQGQMIRKLLEDRARTEAVEGFVLGPYRTFQIALKDLEEATAYDFGKLKDADTLMQADAGREAAAEQLPAIVPIETPEDLVL